MSYLHPSGFYIMTEAVTSTPKKQRVTAIEKREAVRQSIASGKALGSVQLLNYIDKHNIKYKELAKKTGLTVSTIRTCLYPSPKRLPSPLSAILLSWATDYDIHPGLMRPDKFDLNTKYTLEDVHPLRRYLHSKRCTITEFAQACGVSSDYISNIFSRKQKPSSTFIERMVKYTNGEVPADVFSLDKKWIY